ncbi:hypothetical protein [Streptomyces sp. G1]|uniref:hypothetical protein n=1 Tax=Streptomyces sp. G1 TaxID=361572 RepID=UPI00202EBEBF|nr:hypothetical protein [Streptomyces sp. G1]MCM1970464.1 hypothetical protein [Streptomyces sp. G1]
MTYERELPGGPMRVDSAHAAYERELSARHTDTLLAVLRGLASVPGTDAMRQLTVQGDDRPLWRDHDRFRDALAALVDRAAARHGAALAAHVPDFEAAVTAAVWDMYGPHAEAHAAELTGLFTRELGYAPATLTTYQAAYALTTYDLFGLDERDGHFRWCAQQLRRNPVFSA